MMAPHSSDTSTVTLVPDTWVQWRTAINATVAVSRFRRSQTRRRSAEPEQLEPEHQNQNGSLREDGEIHNVEANQGVQLDPDVLDRTLEDKNPEVEVLKQIRDEMVKQLDAYGLVLVLLAGITFVAILQPPGSFDNAGKLQESVLVSLFMLLATLSFFIACTGLGAVMVGCAELFRPFFHAKLAKYADADRLLPVENGLSDTTEAPARQGWFRKWLLGCCEVGSNYVAIDDINVLAELCLENVYRIMRIRIYLGVALVLCISAYICGALAVMVTNHRQRYMLVGAMGAGSVIVLFEMCITLLATMKPEAKRGDGSRQSRFRQGLYLLTTQPWTVFNRPETGRVIPGGV